MMKRVISMFLVLVLCISAFPMHALAAETIMPAEDLQEEDYGNEEYTEEFQLETLLTDESAQIMDEELGATDLSEDDCVSQVITEMQNEDVSDITTEQTEIISDETDNETSQLKEEELTDTLSSDLAISAEETETAATTENTDTKEQLSGCPHENITEYHFLEYSFEGNKTYHIVKETPYEICTDCGETVKELPIERKSEKHEFEYVYDVTSESYTDKRYCGLCGWNPDEPENCKHVEVTTTVQEDYLSVGKDYHIKTWLAVSRCVSCDAIVYQEYKPSGGLEAHNFVDGVCEKCGGKKEQSAECSHETYIDIYDDSNERPPIFETERSTEVSHWVRNPFNRHCKDCGELLKKLYGDPKEEAHTFNEDGMCWCGYGCKHLSSKDYYDDSGNRPLKYENVTAETHGVCSPYNRVCDDCGQIIDEVYSDPEEKPHYFRENGKCDCGQMCDHSFVMKTIENAPVPVTNSGVWESVDKTYHVRKYLRYWEICEICGMEQEGELVEDTAGTKEKHGQWSNTTWTGYSVVDTERHTRKGYKYCGASGCGEKVSLSKTEGHNYVNGKCACGHLAEDSADNGDAIRQYIEQHGLFSDAADYSFQVMHDYTDSYGGMGVYSSLVIDNVLHIGDLLKLDTSEGLSGLNTDQAKSIRVLQTVIGQMDDEYYVEDTKDYLTMVNDLLKMIATNDDFKATAKSFKGLDKFIEGISKKVGDTWYKGYEFQKEYQQYLDEAIASLGEMDSDQLKVLVHSYNNSYKKQVKYENLLNGLHGLNKVSDLLSKIGNAYTISSDVITVLADYSSEMQKLEVLKEACKASNEKHLQEAAEYMEAYYSSFVVRSLSEGEDYLVKYGEKTLGKAWSGVKAAFEYTPAGDIASSCVSLIMLEGLHNTLEHELQHMLIQKSEGQSVSEEEVKKTMHALIDIKILSSELAQNLTSSKQKKDTLKHNIGVLEDMHEQVDTDISFLFR